MKIMKATIENSREISGLMLSDLKDPNPDFPKEMINNFREHAKEENIKKEFENPKLIAFLAVDKDKLDGFIVGYETDVLGAMIHYVSAKSAKTKKELLDNFIKECKTRKMKEVITDTFEFMDNNNFFRLNGFTLFKKEKINNKIETLWYKQKIS